MNEAYVRLVAGQEANWKDRAHFFAFAVRLMRQILVGYARARHAGKRGASVQKLPLDEALSSHRNGRISSSLWTMPSKAWPISILARVASSSCVFLGGLSGEETTEVLGISARQVKRDWGGARAWLHGELTRQRVRS